MPHSQTQDIRTGPRYWAFNANPSVYRIEEAVRNLETDLWTTKGRHVQSGDRVVIWKSMGGPNGKRGVVALGEVIGNPEFCTDVGNPYWVDRGSGQLPEMRVRVRYVCPPMLPLWLGDAQTSVLDKLSVSRGQGTVFKVAEAQWEEVVEAAGGWEAAFPLLGQPIKYEQLGYWYLRLNGFLTIPNFVVHPDVGRNQETDVDIIGVRFPYRAENLQFPMQDDIHFTGKGEKSFIAITEVKAGMCNLNGPWTRPERGNLLRLLYAIGAFSPSESGLVASSLQENGAYTNQLYHISMLCLGIRANEEIAARYRQVPQILWDDVLKFVFVRFDKYRRQKSSHGQWDAAGSELWRICEASGHNPATFTWRVKPQLTV